MKMMREQASSKLNAQTRTTSVLSERREILRKSFVTSRFSYCPIIWMYCQRQSNNFINHSLTSYSLQATPGYKRLRLRYNDYSSCFANLLRKDESVSIHQIKSATQIWSDIVTDVQSDTSAIKNYIESHRNMCSRNLCKLYL